MSAGIPVQVRLSGDEVSALDSYRREKLNPPSRAGALRELANMALQGSNCPRSITPNEDQSQPK
jgi:hypothetical protein